MLEENLTTTTLTVGNKVPVNKVPGGGPGGPGGGSGGPGGGSGGPGGGSGGPGCGSGRPGGGGPPEGPPFK